MNENEYAADVAVYGQAFADRLQEWENGGPELTDHESDRLTRGASPDFRLMCDYSDGLLSPAEAARVEQRLSTDGEFFDRYFLMAAMSPRSPLNATWRPDEILRERSKLRLISRIRRWVLGFALPLILLVSSGIYLDRIRSTAQSNADLAAGRAATGALHFRKRIEAGNAVQVTKLGNAEVKLSPGSRMTVGLVTRLQLAGGGGFVALDGKARVETHKSNLTITTIVAELFLRRDGKFIINAPPGGAPTTVDVIAGSMAINRSAVLRLGQPELLSTVITPGMRVTLTLDGRLTPKPIPAEVH